MGFRLSAGQRRAAVVCGVVAAILFGLVSIRLSADWAKSNAPLVSTPVRAGEITAGIGAQQERAAELANEVDAMAARAQELRHAIALAADRLGGDTATAAQLRDEARVAAARLADLEAQIAQARARLADVTAAQLGPGTAGGGGNVDDEGVEHDDD